jgi:hypothetical protein
VTRFPGPVSGTLETGEIDIEFERGRYRVAGTDREVGIFEVAAATVARSAEDGKR